MASNLPITFNLVLFNPEADYKRFVVPTTSGKPLLQALQVYETTKTDFRFQTKDLPSSGMYVSSVMGQNSGFSQYWSTLLYRANGGFIPLSLDYNVCSDDTVVLHFTDFTTVQSALVGFNKSKS